MNETSLSLLDRVRQSADSESWDRLVRLDAPLMKNWLGRYEIQDSDDLVQEVLTTVVTELPKFEHNQRPGAFRSWLRTILATKSGTSGDRENSDPVSDATVALPGVVRTPAVELPEELKQHSRYRIVELLGRDRMGDVYKAEHKMMDREVALKVIKPQRLGYTFFALLAGQAPFGTGSVMDKIKAHREQDAPPSATMYLPKSKRSCKR